MHASDRGLGPWAYPPSPLETPLSPLGTTSGLKVSQRVFQGLLEACFEASAEA